MPKPGALGPEPPGVGVEGIGVAGKPIDGIGKAHGPPEEVLIAELEQDESRGERIGGHSAQILAREKPAIVLEMSKVGEPPMNRRAIRVAG
jgi:hypothetical protein